jgi:hypothetical protein
MKKYFSVILLIFFVTCIYAQPDIVEEDTLEVKYIELPDSTAIGTPDGKLVSKEIGPAGGTIISEDGKVKLIFPEGALTTTTTISIQPIVNLIPNGNGKAYKLEPSGIQFLKSVEIFFTYTPEEEEVCPAILKFMALQSSNGKWEYMNFDDWDSTTMSLKGSISHFSAVMNGNLMELSTVDTTLKVGESFELSLNIAGAASGDDELPLLPMTNERAKWSLKGSGKLNRKGGYYTTYTAPDYLPQKDAKVELTIRKTTIERIVQTTTRHGRIVWKGETLVPHHEKFSFTCNIKLYDHYRITVIKEGQSVLDCGAELDDRSFFITKLFPRKRPEIYNEINSEPTLTKKPNCSGESSGGRVSRGDYPIKYSPAGCKGPVHVMPQNLSGYGMTINTNAAPDIRLEFTIAYVKIMTIIGKLPEEIHEFTKSLMGGSVGNSIKFKANREHQDITIDGNDPIDSYRLIIEPL